MLKSYVFPSVYEAINRELPNVADNILNGIRVKVNDEDYMVGNLALTEGYSPHKNFNGAPTENEYNLLSKASLLLTQPKRDEELFLTTGFPFSTYLLYREQVKDQLLGTHNILYDASTFGGTVNAKKEIIVSKVEILPEILGCITAIREGGIQEKDNFFIVSLGYGTCEVVVSTRSGIINRSAVSTQGIRHAVNILSNELQKNLYLNLKTEHQIDVAFQRGNIIVNRTNRNLSEIREKALKTYYHDIISPAMRKAFLDDDFNKCSKMYVVGGGALYPELVDCFRQEFNGIVSIETYPEPEKCASHGYCLNSRQKIAGSFKSNVKNADEGVVSRNPQLAVGLDIGNANTCVTVYRNED
ncbi:MAG: ParM/StbA family protein [Candidatus Azobacteroides sp.]|nr:ParM/StbA family protein [Candidatus Azobacteroides sp.]